MLLRAFLKLLGSMFVNKSLLGESTEPVVKRIRHALRVGDAFIHPEKVVHNVEVLFNSEMSMLPHITHVVRTCYTATDKPSAQFVRTLLKRHVRLQKKSCMVLFIGSTMPTCSWLEYRGHPCVGAKLCKRMQQGS